MLVVGFQFCARPVWTPLRTSRSRCACTSDGRLARGPGEHLQQQLTINMLPSLKCNVHTARLNSRTHTIRRVNANKTRDLEKLFFGSGTKQPVAQNSQLTCFMVTWQDCNYFAHINYLLWAFPCANTFESGKLGRLSAAVLWSHSCHVTDTSIQYFLVIKIWIACQTCKRCIHNVIRFEWRCLIHVIVGRRQFALVYIIG